MNLPVKGQVEKVPAPQSDTAALINMIERVARDPAVDIDKLQRLMDMQERVIERNARAAYAAALADMQAELPVISRKGRIEVREKDKDGKRTGDLQQSTPYALWEDINEAIKPSLKKYGFALSFRIGLAQDGKITVTGILSHRDGHSEETTITLQHDSTGSKNAVQAVGSSVSYGKRYTAGALLNFTSRGEDDDGKTGGSSSITAGQVKELQALAKEVGADLGKTCKHFEIDSIDQLPANKFAPVKAGLETKRTPL